MKINREAFTTVLTAIAQGDTVTTEDLEKAQEIIQICQQQTPPRRKKKE